MNYCIHMSVVQMKKILKATGKLQICFPLNKKSSEFSNEKVPDLMY